MKNIDDEIQSTKQQIEQLTHRQDRLVSKLKVEEQKKRTRRLIVRGAILESVIENSADFSNEQIQALLIEIFSSEFVRVKLRKCENRLRIAKIPCFNKGALIHLVEASCISFTLPLAAGFAYFAAPPLPTKSMILREPF